jgi:hypothetical protein
MAEKGFFLITDISGYTSFLSQSELEHAQHIIEELFSCQLKTLDEHFKVSNFQGDAILSYLPLQPDGNGQLIIDNSRALYRAFNEKIAQMKVAPPCHCKACSTIDLLDIKMFLHFGEYLVKRLGEREELMGQDVIIAHRMMKNSVVEKTGIASYLLVSEAAREQIKADIEHIPALDYADSYEHIGHVNMSVIPLAAI